MTAPFSHVGSFRAMYIYEWLKSQQSVWFNFHLYDAIDAMYI